MSRFRITIPFVLYVLFSTTAYAAPIDYALLHQLLFWKRWVKPGREATELRIQLARAEPD